MTRLLNEMAREFAAIDARDAKRPGLSHPCGCCGLEAVRVSFDEEVAVYRCLSCEQRTVVDHSTWPPVEWR